MTTRTSSKTVTFARPFLLKGVDRVLPAGEYKVATDEELIEGLSFPAYHRVATIIYVPAEAHAASSVEMVTIDPHDLREAQNHDAAPPASAATVQCQFEMTREKGSMLIEDSRVDLPRSRMLR